MGAQEESGTDQEYEAHRHLGGDQEGTPRGGRANRPAAGLHGAVEVDAERLGGRREAGHQSGGQDDGAQVGQHLQVGSGLVNGHADGGEEAREEGGRLECNGGAEGSGGGGQQEDFDKEHAGEAEASGADSQTNAHFAAAGDRAGELEHGGIGAGDQEDQGEGAHDDRADPEELRPQRRLLSEGAVGDVHRGLPAGFEPVEPGGDHGQLGLRLRPRAAGPQSAFHGKPWGAVLAKEVLALEKGALHRPRNPDARTAETPREAGGQDAGYGESHPVDPESAADHLRVGGELAFPQLLPDQKHRSRAGLAAFGRGEEPALERRAEAVDLEEIAGDEEGELRLAIALSERSVDRAPGRQRAQRLGSRGVRAVIPRREQPRAGAAALPVPEFG